MRRLLYILVLLFLSSSVYGTADLMFGLIKPAPKGDTDIDSVRVTRIYGDNAVILSRTLEIFRSDRHFVYYNLFYPEKTSDSTINICKARIQVPKNFRFKHGRHGYSGETTFCFGNDKEWFLALFNISSESDSTKIEVYLGDDVVDKKWDRYHDAAKAEIFQETNSMHPTKNKACGFYKLMNNVLYFDVKKSNIKIGEDILSSFEIIDKKTFSVQFANNKISNN